MTIKRNCLKIAALSIALAAALPVAAQTEVRLENNGQRYHYVYYRDHDVYFAPESKTYYWRENGEWQSSTVLPVNIQPYIAKGGVEIDLDTARPYERNDYVVAHYKSGPEMTRETTTTTDDRNGMSTTTTTTTTTKHRYTYYADRNVYFSPDTKTYFWRDKNGSWQSGDALPADIRPYVNTGGMAIELDTDRPYERQEYVVRHYVHHDQDHQ